MEARRRKGERGEEKDEEERKEKMGWFTVYNTLL